MWNRYISTSSVEETLEILHQEGNAAKIIAGGTDLFLELEQGKHAQIRTLVDISRIGRSDQITLDKEGTIHIGAGVTHNLCVASHIIRTSAYPLALASWKVGSPQIRNRGTVAGNVITGSPANDTISPLLALDASVVLRSTRGERRCALKDFIIGPRKTLLESDEMLVEIIVPGMKPNAASTFLKQGLRNAQAISLVNLTVILETENGVTSNARIAAGSVAPTVIRASEAEQFLLGKRIDEKIVEEAANLALKAIKPIGDLRSTSDYRQEMVRVLTRRGLMDLIAECPAVELPVDPVLLRGKKAGNKALTQKTTHQTDTPISTKVNGVSFSLVPQDIPQKSLLRFLREDLQLTGSKEGCAEGECGACTVFLDNVAVMSCLVPAQRAHGAEITTIEDIAHEGELHPVQQAFIDYGAVQCGYCTPGFIMSAVKLMEEKPTPTPAEIRDAMTGNLCRCTGYYKIIQAIESVVSEGCNIGG